MKFAPVPLSEAKGKILGHNIAGTNGQRFLQKGKPLTDEALEKLRALGRTSIYVAEMEPDDVDENRATRRVAEAILGMILSGSTSIHERLISDFAPLRDRIEKLGFSVTRTRDLL
jgi:hypothetical protein